MNSGSHHDEYAEASAQRDLAEDGGIAEQGIDVIRRDGVIQLRGNVESDERRKLIGERVRNHFPDSEVRNDIVVVRVTRPVEAEELR
jgi:osmotically-inducible protein OsmY